MTAASTSKYAPATYKEPGEISASDDEVQPMQTSSKAPFTVHLSAPSAKTDIQRRRQAGNGGSLIKPADAISVKLTQPGGRIIDKKQAASIASIHEKKFPIRSNTLKVYPKAKALKAAKAMKSGQTFKKKDKKHQPVTFSTFIRLLIQSSSTRRLPNASKLPHLSKEEKSKQNSDSFDEEVSQMREKISSLRLELAKEKKQKKEAKQKRLTFANMYKEMIVNDYKKLINNPRVAIDFEVIEEARLKMLQRSSVLSVQDKMTPGRVSVLLVKATNLRNDWDRLLVESEKLKEINVGMNRIIADAEQRLRKVQKKSKKLEGCINKLQGQLAEGEVFRKKLHNTLLELKRKKKESKEPNSDV